MKGKHRHTRPSDGSSGGNGRANGHRSNGNGERGRTARPAVADVGGKKMWLYGIHPVLAALANRRRGAGRVVLAAGAEGSVGPRLDVLAQSHPSGLPRPEILTRDSIERVLPRGAVHQGVAAQVQGLDDTDIEDICRATDGQDGARVVILDQVTDPHNVGAVIRSAAAFGAAAVILPERNSPGDGGVLAKAASGALERVPLVRVVNLARALGRLKQAGFWCVGLDGDAQLPSNERDC